MRRLDEEAASFARSIDALLKLGVTTCTLRDTFGVDTRVTRSRDADGVPWSMFELSTEPGAPEYPRHLFLLR